MTRPRRSAGSSPRQSKPSSILPQSYLAESERPWTSLIFVLPLVLVYEAYAAGWLATGGFGTVSSPRVDIHIRAFLLIREFFALFGAAGIHLPALTLLCMLLTGQIASGSPWRIRLSTLAGMGGESVLWAIPVLALGWLLARVPLAGTDGWATTRLVALCFGAGVYEEMVFRLLGLTVLSLILRDLMRLRQGLVTVVVVCLSGVLFSLYHYLGPQESFRWSTFWFRTGAGCYFALLYTLRGFGITASSHATYDVFVVIFIAP